MAKKQSTNVAQLEAVKTRAGMAEQLEKERLELKNEMEKLMKEYAKATGLKKLGKRQHKVGKAPNDFKA
jgi:chemotaxis regulatin CheY-phosphate phosphatase CheZ